MSMLGSRTTSKASPVTLTEPPVSDIARSVSRSATAVIWIGRPARRVISS
jgi:hypothetical protein